MGLGMGARRDLRPPRAGRRVTLRRWRERGAVAPREPHRERTRRRGAAGEGSPFQTHRDGATLFGAAGRASAPAGLRGEEARGPLCVRLGELRGPGALCVSSVYCSNPWTAPAGLGHKVDHQHWYWHSGENLRLGSIFAAVTSVPPRDAQPGITELTAAYFTHRYNLLGCRDEWGSLFRPTI